MQITNSTTQDVTIVVMVIGISLKAINDDDDYEVGDIDLNYTTKQRALSNLNGIYLKCCN